MEPTIKVEEWHSDEVLQAMNDGDELGRRLAWLSGAST